MIQDHYTVHIFWSEQDGLFIGTCPEFEGLAVVGNTRAEAFKEAEAAIDGYIQIHDEDGTPLPAPGKK